MPYFALHYQQVCENYVEKRAAFREIHLGLAREFYDRGELLLGGALTDPIDSALLVFIAPDASVVESFVARDPYVQNGLITRYAIRNWNVVVGNAPHPRVAESATPFNAK